MKQSKSQNLADRPNLPDFTLLTTLANNEAKTSLHIPASVLFVCTD